ncbi:hypothetical protein Bca52824_001492 [Brassica carinata]|uniref:Uncharacterized protein n=1 Tax=Brassica carinata TaxID=52824 RepID=A0A8X8BDZ6_BRACI|nr:hypothetical protein Bca52824_001492 [Brassica carinata]
MFEKDEKLENVLGYFQKDFEGGVVSAEKGSAISMDSIMDMDEEDALAGIHLEATQLEEQQSTIEDVDDMCKEDARKTTNDRRIEDSGVVTSCLTLLNRRHSYGLDRFLLSIDEWITGYRDDSLETVRFFP